MPSQPLPLPKLSSRMFVAVHREGVVPCWLLDSMKNDLVSSECTSQSFHSTIILEGVADLVCV